MNGVVNWSEEVQRYFGDVTAPTMLAKWEKVKSDLPIGSNVRGRVVLKAPFGVWIDIDMGFPSLLLVTRLKESHTYESYCDHGPAVGTQIDATVCLFNDEDRQLVLTQLATTPS